MESERARHDALVKKMINESALAQLYRTIGSGDFDSHARQRLTMADRMLSLAIQRARSLGCTPDTLSRIREHQAHLKQIKGKHR